MICYVGGTGGDFLKTLCLQQFKSDIKIEHNITDTGLVLHNRQYFKDITLDYYNNKIDSEIVDWSQVDPVENSHYYFDWFATLTDQFYYIDFPESATTGIIDVYVSKRHQGNLMHFVETHKHTLPPGLQDKVTEKNARQFFSVLWSKQIRIWKTMPNMHAIELCNFFNRQNLIDIVQQLTQQPVQDFDQFDQTFTTWIEKNSVLKELVC